MKFFYHSMHLSIFMTDCSNHQSINNDKLIIWNFLILQIASRDDIALVEVAFHTYLPIDRILLIRFRFLPANPFLMLDCQFLRYNSVVIVSRYNKATSTCEYHTCVDACYSNLKMLLSWYCLWNEKPLSYLMLNLQSHSTCNASLISLSSRYVSKPSLFSIFYEFMSTNSFLHGGVTL